MVCWRSADTVRWNLHENVLHVRLNEKRCSEMMKLSISLHEGLENRRLLRLGFEETARLCVPWRKLKCTHRRRKLKANIIARNTSHKRNFDLRPWVAASARKQKKDSRKKHKRKKCFENEKCWIKRRARGCVGETLSTHSTNSLDGYINLWEVFRVISLHIFAYLWKFEFSERLWNPTTRDLRRLSASFARWRMGERENGTVHRRMIENLFSLHSAFCESVCRLKTVEIQLDVEFSTSADLLMKWIWIWLAFPECHCGLSLLGALLSLATFNVDVVRYF